MHLGTMPSMRKILRASTAPALLGSVLAFGATAAMAAEKVFDRAFTVTPGGVLSVNADGAHISVSGSDANQVVVHMVGRGSQDEIDDMRLSAEQSGSGVSVELRSERRNWSSHGQESSIDVRVPRGYRVEAKTSGGDVRLESIAGPSRIRTSGGNIMAKGVKGDVDLETSGGDVRLESMEGSIEAHTSGGNIHSASIRGDINANTSGGDLRLLGVDGKIRASTSGGDVECELVGANRGITASTSGGSIRLRLPKDVAGKLEAESSGGSIDSDFSVATTHWEQNRLNGLINGGGPSIRVHTTGGEITLTAAK